MIPSSNLQRFNPDNWLNLKVTNMQIKFCFCHFSRLMSLKPKLASITWHVLNSLADLRSASTSKCCFPFLDVSPSGKSLIFLAFFCLFETEVHRKTVWRVSEYVSVYKCLKVIWCTYQTGINAWQRLMAHMAVHFTASRFLLWANWRWINFMTTRKTITLFHIFVWRYRVEESATFIKNLTNCHFLFL